MESNVHYWSLDPWTDVLPNGIAISSGENHYYASQNSQYNEDISIYYHISGHQKKIAYASNGDIYAVILRVYEYGSTPTVDNQKLEIWRLKRGSQDFVNFANIEHTDDIYTFCITINKDIIFVSFDDDDGNGKCYTYYYDLNLDPPVNGEASTSFEYINTTGVTDYRVAPVTLNNDWGNGNNGFLNGITPIAISDADNNKCLYGILHSNACTNLLTKHAYIESDCQLLIASQTKLTTTIAGYTSCLISDKNSNVYNVGINIKSPMSQYFDIFIRPFIWGLPNDEVTPSYYVGNTLKLNLPDVGSYVKYRSYDCAYNPIENKIYFLVCFSNSDSGNIEIYMFEIDLDSGTCNYNYDELVTPIVSYPVSFNILDPEFMASPTIGCDNNGTMWVIYEEVFEDSGSKYTALRYIKHTLNATSWTSPSDIFSTRSNKLFLRPRLPRRIYDNIPIFTFDVVEGELSDINEELMGGLG